MLRVKGSPQAELAADKIHWLAYLSIISILSEPQTIEELIEDKRKSATRFCNLHDLLYLKPKRAIFPPALR